MLLYYYYVSIYLLIKYIILNYHNMIMKHNYNLTHILHSWRYLNTCYRNLCTMCCIEFSFFKIMIQIFKLTHLDDISI